MNFSIFLWYLIKIEVYKVDKIHNYEILDITKKITIIIYKRVDYQVTINSIVSEKEGPKVKSTRVIIIANKITLMIHIP
jgi:hypothetical protein